MWLDASGQPTRERKVSLQKACGLLGGCELRQMQAWVDVDVCMSSPLHARTPRAWPVWCRTNPTRRRCREWLLQNPHCMRCAFPVNTHSVYNAGAIKSGISPAAGKSADLKLGKVWWPPQAPWLSSVTFLVYVSPSRWKNGFHACVKAVSKRGCCKATARRKLMNKDLM